MSGKLLWHKIKAAKSPLLIFCQCGIFWWFLKKFRPDSESKKPKRVTLNWVISEWIYREQSKTKTSDLVLGPVWSSSMLFRNNIKISHSAHFDIFPILYPSYYRWDIFWARAVFCKKQQKSSWPVNGLQNRGFLKSLLI